MIVWISGPTGAGKSALATKLAAVGFASVNEDVPEDLMAAFVADPRSNCVKLQMEIMMSRLRRWQPLCKAPRLVFDRSIDEDIEVFCTLHSRLGFLDDHALTTLRSTAREIQQVLPRPDLVIYLDPPASILRMRMAQHPRIISESLGLQLSLYDEWRHQIVGNVLAIDNSRCSLETIMRFLWEIANA
jgi:deoxyadenosine/deoxycytidine kinase